MQDYTNPSILSGDIASTPDNDADNTYHVFITANLGSAATIDGFTISGGNADGSENLSYSTQRFYRDDGGGMNNFSSSPTITNSTFSGSTTTNNGGGIFNNGSSFPMLYNIVLYANTATGAGDDINGLINESSSHNASDGTGGDIGLGNGFAMLTDDPFIDSTDPDGADDIFRTADDGLVPIGTTPLIDAGDDDKNE